MPIAPVSTVSTINFTSMAVAYLEISGTSEKPIILASSGPAGSGLRATQRER